MAAGSTDEATSTVLDSIRGTRDALTVRRVFGDAYELDGVTIIPVARVIGGAGGGGGGGEGPGERHGTGFGTGFGIVAHPIGVYEVRGGNVEWKPAVDVNRLAKGGQVLAAIIAICAAMVLRSRRR